MIVLGDFLHKKIRPPFKPIARPSLSILLLKRRSASFTDAQIRLSLRHALVCPTEATGTNITHDDVVRYGTQVPTRQYVLTPLCLVNACQSVEAIWTDDLDLSYPLFHMIRA
jgi:hypothetical protein